ncbi:alpha/beta hydrolase family protein [Streptomyces sp. NPDC091272]|uniref:alpha/beta hydrolase family protein n=1 Tax=Streptomyces sp. NPDC091272 TaxID=3365981 RepID=UPI003808EC92
MIALALAAPTASAATGPGAAAYGGSVAVDGPGAAVYGGSVASTGPGATSYGPVAVSTQLRLPAPTGRFGVGRKELHLVDSSRADPWAPVAAPRELMVSMFYPARRGGAGSPSAYLDRAEARLLVAGIGHADDVPAELLSGARTNSRTGARAAGGAYPLVVLSPGFTLHRATLTGLAEELTSRGYVVAVVDHAYESYGTSFPGGRTLTCAACGHAAMKQIPAVRSADVSFLIDELLGPRSEFRGMIDRGRIGMAGHSIGGNSAAVAMADDPRIRAGANLDGGFQDATPGAGLNGRPFLLLGTDASHRPELGKGKWLEAWQRMDGWKRWLTVAGSGHFSFNDVPVLGEPLGLVDPKAPLSGKRSGEITNGYVGAFFDRHLRGRHSPLLDGPTAANPEVTFHHP